MNVRSNRGSRQNTAANFRPCSQQLRDAVAVDVAGADRTESLCAPSVAKLKRIAVGVNAVMTVITVITTAAAY